MKKYLKIIDDFFCKYLALSKQDVTPSLLKVHGNKITVISTESFKRHSYSKSVNEFITNKIDELDENNKKKFGSAIGKVIAKNLTISFENISIKKGHLHD